MNNPPLNSTNLPIYPTHTDAGVANDHTVAPDCGSKSFAGFRQISKAEPSSMLQAMLEIPELGSRILSYLSSSDLSRVEAVSKRFRDNILRNRSKEIACFRELPDTTQCRVKKRIESDSDYLIDYLERFSTTKPEGYFRAMQHRKPKAFVEIIYFNLREISGQNLSFDTELKAAMVHENRVHTVQSSADIPVILSSSDAEVKIVELIRGTQWVETLSIPYGRIHWGKYRAQLFANGTCLVINNSTVVKIFERSRDGKWDHKTSLFDDDDTAREATEFVSPNSCHVLVNANCIVDELKVSLTKYGGKNSDGKWIELPLGVTDRVFVLDVTRDGRCALVRDTDDLLICDLTDDGPEVSTQSYINSRKAKFSPDGTRVWSNYGRNGAKVYIRGNQGNWLEEYIIEDENDRYWLWDIKFSPDGTTIALNDSYRVEIHGQQGEGVWGRQAVFDDFSGRRIFLILFSPCGTHGVITLFSGRDTGEKAQRIIGKISNGSWVEKASVAANDLVVFSPDQIHVAVYSASDQRITLCELTDEEALPEVTIIEQSQTVNSIEFSTEGSYLVTGSDDGMVRIWGQTGNRRWTERATIAHDEPVHLVQFVMEMTHVLACCNNRTNLYELKPNVLSFSV